MVHPTPAWTARVCGPASHKFHPVRYQSQAIADTMENSVCSTHPVLAECLSMECHSIDRTGRGVVLALVPVQGKRVPSRWLRARAVGSPPWGSPLGAPGFLPSLWWRHLPDMMGSLRVKGTAAPEVKFLDRCKTNSGAGVLQGRVRRSRARAWGSKMIRHRRSPGP